MDCTINRKLIPGKVSFFAMLSASLWVHPFMILFFKQLGLSTTECSIIYGSMPILTGFSKLFFGAIADKFQKHKELMFLFSILSAISLSCMLLVPPVEKQIQLEPLWNEEQLCQQDVSRMNSMLECTVSVSGEEMIVLNNCTHKTSALDTYLAECRDVYRNRVTMSRSPNDSQHDYTNLSSVSYCILNCTRMNFKETRPEKSDHQLFGKIFWMILCLYSLTIIMYGSIWTCLYGMVYAVLGERRNIFGKQRMWGTFGALTTSIISAVAMNKYGSITPEITYIPCFIGYGFWIVITGVSGIFFKLPPIPRNPTMAKDMFKLLKQPQIVLLFTVLFIMGFLFGAVDTFLFVFLRSLNASSWTLGACLFVQYIGEIPALYFSGRIIKKLGHVKCLYLVLFAYSIRYLGTSLIPNPWWELPFSCIRSVVFSIGFTAVSVYSSLITPPSMHATLQATVQAIHFALGRGVGILAFGPTMDAIGARWSFRVGSIMALVTCILYAIIQQFMPPVKLTTHNQRGDIKPDKGDKVMKFISEKDSEEKNPAHQEVQKLLNGNIQS